MQNSQMHDLDLLTFARGNSAHESGHIVVLFKAGRLVDLRFLPHEAAADGIKGVFEANTGTELGKEDCVALAAGMAGELVCLGHYDSERVLHDRQQIQRIVGKALEDFAPEAQETIEQNLRFFSLLNIEVLNRITALLLDLGGVDWEKLPPTIPIITLADVEQVYRRAESEKSTTP
jgi:hypothetical protein